ncbi:type I pullulanase [Streptococcus himalayensis]|uniref:pullulanase n=1 Tax=Streptococcus himalayensis TaxID=1888195 RepID=A0A917AAA1_9STRE|nr:type I pullulanase [Streptococcus himalayensis]GGE37926.1 type I pullulanase [Streptococcus himalayensis]
MFHYRVLLHYHRKDGNESDHQVWQWRDGEHGFDVLFTEEDDFGAFVLLDYPTYRSLDWVYALVKSPDWTKQSVDYQISLLPPHLVTEVWVIEGDDCLYYSRQAAETSPFYARSNPHAFDMALDSQSFDRYWGYAGTLGCEVEEKQTIFKVWAPTAKSVELHLYSTAEHTASLQAIYSLERGEEKSCNHQENTIGVWSLTIPEDLLGHAYQYQLDFGYKRELTRDPYSRATSPDGKRTAIVSETECRIEPLEKARDSKAPWRLDNPCQAVIYEMHIRDLTQSSTSGVTKALSGTFLGACEKGTTNSYGQKTAFDYIQSLGVNVVQLQPVSDRHKEYDKHGHVLYNWGYDPQNYNALESSFSTNPSDPAQVIRDFKTMVQAYHEAGISVVLDVVYNHIYSTLDSPFQKTVPDYYYRMNPDGSFQNGTGVGSETASEHEMFRKYMIDSLTYWVKEYDVDGFRFDLMGIHDVDTMRAIREALDELDPRILLYGEGWDMGLGLAAEEKAKKDNAYRLSGIGFFNDNERDAIKGAEVYGGLKAGFVSGEATEPIIAKSILGSRELGTYLAPHQVLNYVEAHDNYNLHDLLATLHPNESKDRLNKRIELATAMNLLLQGMSFMELGQEFSRTKLLATGAQGEVTQKDRERAMNSYNAPDSVNQVNWDLLELHKESIDFIRQIISLKTKAQAFSYQTYEDIYQQVYIHSAAAGSGLIIFEIKADKHYLIVFNASGEGFAYENAGNLKVLVTNSSKENPNILDDLSATVFEIC